LGPILPSRPLFIAPDFTSLPIAPDLTKWTIRETTATIRRR